MDSVLDAPYHLVRSMLLKVKSAEKLVSISVLIVAIDINLNSFVQRQIEIKSPQICGEDGELWLKFIKRDVSGWETKKHRPEDPIGPDDWYNLYWALRVEAQRELELDEQRVGAAMLKIKTESEKHRTQHVLPSEVPPLPKMGAMKLIKTPKKKRKSLALVAEKPDKLVFSVGSTTKVKSDKDFVKKACRQERERQSYFGPDSKLSRPTSELAAESTRVDAAPRSLVHDYRNPAWKPHDPSIKRPEVFVPKRKIVEPGTAPSPLPPRDNQRRELAIKRKRLESDESFIPDLPVGKKRRMESSVKATSTAASLAPKPLSSLDQPRIIAPIRRQVVESSAPGPTTAAEKQDKILAMIKTTYGLGRSAPAPPSSVGQTRVTAPKRKRVDSVAASAPDQPGEKERGLQSLVETTDSDASAPPTPPSSVDQPRTIVPEKRRADRVESSASSQKATIGECGLQNSVKGTENTAPSSAPSLPSTGSKECPVNLTNADGGAVRRIKTKAPVNIFMPVKRRRLA